jgi:hypothetical protein
MLVADGVVVRVVKHPEGFVKRLEARSQGSRTKVSKNQVVWARCHFTGLASGIDCTQQSSADSGAQFQAASHAPAGSWRRSLSVIGKLQGIGFQGSGKKDRKPLLRSVQQTLPAEAGAPEQAGEIGDSVLVAVLGVDALAAAEVAAAGWPRYLRRTAGFQDASRCATSRR